MQNRPSSRPLRSVGSVLRFELLENRQLLSGNKLFQQLPLLAEMLKDHLPPGLVNHFQSSGQGTQLVKELSKQHHQGPNADHDSNSKKEDWNSKKEDWNSNGELRTASDQAWNFVKDFLAFVNPPGQVNMLKEGKDSKSGNESNIGSDRTWHPSETAPALVNQVSDDNVLLASALLNSSEVAELASGSEAILPLPAGTWQAPQSTTGINLVHDPVPSLESNLAPPPPLSMPPLDVTLESIPLGGETGDLPSIHPLSTDDPLSSAGIVDIGFSNLPPAHDVLSPSAELVPGPGARERQAGHDPVQWTPDMVGERDQSGATMEMGAPHATATYFVGEDTATKLPSSPMALTAITLGRETSTEPELVSLSPGLPSEVGMVVGDLVFSGAGTEEMGEPGMDGIVAQPEEVGLLDEAQSFDQAALDAALALFLGEVNELGDHGATALSRMEIPVYLAVVAVSAAAWEIRRRSRRRKQPALSLAAGGSATTLTWMTGTTPNTEW